MGLKLTMIGTKVTQKREKICKPAPVPPPPPTLLVLDLLPSKPFVPLATVLGNINLKKGKTITKPPEEKDLARFFSDKLAGLVGLRGDVESSSEGEDDQEWY